MKSILGFVIGVVITAIIGWNIMPGMMLHENPSPYGLEETVSKIKDSAIKKGWVVPSVKPLHKSILKHGGGEVEPVMLVNLCNANHAYNILHEDENKIISVFMPCTISVYQKSDGKVYIGTMNAGLLGQMFSGTVAEVMADVAADQQSFIEFAK
jgi:uncharacterized protein (DUF302 family)